MRCKSLLRNFQIVFYKLKIKSSNESNSKINTISPNISNILYSDSIPLHKILSQILSYPNTDITYKKKDHTIMKPHFYWRLIFCFLHARFNWQIKIATLRKNSKRLSFEKKGKEIETFKSQKESERHWCMISVAPYLNVSQTERKKSNIISFRAITYFTASVLSAREFHPKRILRAPTHDTYFRMCIATTNTRNNEWNTCAQ